MENIIEDLRLELEGANSRIEALQAALNAEKDAHIKTQTKLPVIEKGLIRVNQLIYDMKSALANADETYRATHDLFSSIIAPAFPAKSAQTLAQLYNNGRSLSEMAAIILGDKKKKTAMFRMVESAKKKNPELFTKR